MSIRKYSTGPLENFVANQSDLVRVKVLNNSNRTITARVKVFELNGTKNRTFLDTLTIPAKSSDYLEANVSSLAQFEVQIRVSGSGSSAERVLLSVFGITANDELNPSHRVVHKELKRI